MSGVSEKLRRMFIKHHIPVFFSNPATCSGKNWYTPKTVRHTPRKATWRMRSDAVRNAKTCHAAPQIPFSARNSWGVRSSASPPNGPQCNHNGCTVYLHSCHEQTIRRGESVTICQSCQLQVQFVCWGSSVVWRSVQDVGITALLFKTCGKTVEKDWELSD